MTAFVIAMQSEASCLRQDALRSLGEGGHLYLSGIGKVNAAAATMAAIKDGATEIVNWGLVGCISGRGVTVPPAIGSLFEVSTAVEYDFDLAELNHTAPGILNERTSPYIPMRTTGRYPAAILCTGDRFTNSIADHELLRSFAQGGVLLRDMEGAAIAHICEKCHIPCRSLKCVSDVAGQKDRMTDQFLSNQEYSLKCLSAALTSWI